MTGKNKNKRANYKDGSSKTGIELFLFDNDDIKMIFIIINYKKDMNQQKNYQEEKIYE